MSASDIRPDSLQLSSDDSHMQKELLKPFTYVTSVPGKKIRLNLVQALGQWILIAEEKLKLIEEIVHSMHHAGILLDDIQDSSFLRRGIPTAHTIYGIPRTVIAVDMLARRICDLLHQLQNNELTKKCNKHYIEIMAGQGMELYWRDNYICPTEEEYLQMVYRKTSLLFVMVQDLMNILTTSKKTDVKKLLTYFGIYFQIHDDYQNLQSQFYYDSKGFCEDITEGKFSFPIVHAINNYPKEGKVIISILRERTHDIERKKQCLSILEECGSFEYTRKVIKEIKSNVYTELAKFDENSAMIDFIEKTMFTFL